MFSLNRAQIVGNVTRDPEMRYTPNGQAVTSFSVATNRRWRDKDGNNQEQTEFHNVVAWRKAAEIISQYVKKGNKIYIEGRLQTRQWEGQDGGQRSRTEIVVDDFILLSPKGSGGDGGDFTPDKEAPDEVPAEKPKTKKDDAKAETDEEEINLDEIPF